MDSNIISQNLLSCKKIKWHASIHNVEFHLLWDAEKYILNLQWQQMSGCLRFGLGIAWDGAQGTFSDDGNILYEFGRGVICENPIKYTGTLNCCI